MKTETPKKKNVNVVDTEGTRSSAVYCKVIPHDSYLLIKTPLRRPSHRRNESKLEIVAGEWDT